MPKGNGSSLSSMTPQRPEPVSERLRAEILRSERALRDLARETELQPSQLSRFARGLRGLESHAIDRLAAAFGLELQPVKARRSRGGRS